MWYILYLISLVNMCEYLQCTFVKQRNPTLASVYWTPVFFLSTCWNRNILQTCIHLSPAILCHTPPLFSSFLSHSYQSKTLPIPFLDAAGLAEFFQHFCVLSQCLGWSPYRGDLWLPSSGKLVEGNKFALFLPASCSNLKTETVVLVDIAALPTIWSFLAAFPAVIWSFDLINTCPGLSSSSYTSLVLPSFNFFPILRPEEYVIGEMLRDQQIPKLYFRVKPSNTDKDCWGDQIWTDSVGWLSNHTKQQVFEEKLPLCQSTLNTE